MQILNRPHQSGKFNFTTQFPHYKEVLYRPQFGGRRLGRPVIFDMDMSVGDFLALFYLLKVPIEVINLKVNTLLATVWKVLMHLSTFRLAIKVTFYLLNCGHGIQSKCCIFI